MELCKNFRFADRQIQVDHLPPPIGEICNLKSSLNEYVNYSFGWRV